MVGPSIIIIIIIIINIIVIIIIILKFRDSVHLLFSLNISVSHPSQSQ